VRWLLVTAMAVGCGAAPATRVETAPPPATHVAPFAGHGALVLRSRSPEAQPALYAELAEDGSIAGARCGASRFTDEGALEREGVVIARIDDGDAVLADGTALGWRIDQGTLITAGETRFTLSEGTITPSDTELPTIEVVPAGAPAALTLSVFALLLVCDDVGP
jgi:hypothetical protein